MTTQAITTKETGAGRKIITSGAVAQLEEYLNGIQGVEGSNPFSSTNLFNNLQKLTVS